MKKLGIGGVTSSKGKVAIYSKDFMSIVSYDCYNKPKYVVGLYRNKTDRHNKFERDLKKFQCFLIITMLFSTLLTFCGRIILSTPVLLKSGIISLFILSTILVLTLFGIISMKNLFARLHGAEHKVLKAYRSEEEYDISIARKCSPISMSCSTIYEGFQFAMSLIGLLTALIGIYCIYSVWFLVVMWVIVIDVCFFNHFSIIFINFIGKYTQYFFTVREPSEEELLAAHCALLGLLIAHGENVKMPPEAVLIEENRYVKRNFFS